MGREKDRLIEEEERGWYSVTRRYVCDSCISEPALVDYIRDRGVECECGCCGLTPEDADLKCLPLDEVLHVDTLSHFLRNRRAHSFELGGAGEVQDDPDASATRIRSPVRGLNHSTE